MATAALMAAHPAPVPAAGPENQPASPAAEADAPADPQAVLHARWQAQMAVSETPGEGCYQAAYPDLLWHRTDCREAHPRAHPVRAHPEGRPGEITGNGNDFVALAQGLITRSIGHFSIAGVKSEAGVGVPAFGGGGILGPNEYSLQINTNASATTTACARHSGCTVWQQFLYATDYTTKGEAAVFIQYWLVHWGSGACPAGWTRSQADCWRNSAYVAAPDMAITSLGKLSLTATASAGATDTLVFGTGTRSYALTTRDSVLEIGSVWTESEFNVVGNGGGSRADFNSGSSVTVTLSLTDGSVSAPLCAAHVGLTGETNNLNLGACVASGGTPTIRFIESN
ncbi:MAG: hypothetical protein JSS29_16515 [Proteobacteria bacterium]|nr:hypothetical protein [Pseudomonadota bacterium]